MLIFNTAIEYQPVSSYCSISVGERLANKGSKAKKSDSWRSTVPEA